MTRLRTFRLLRIAFSITCGIACVLLIVLWVRSYWRFDIILRFSPNSAAEIRSNGGTVYVYYESPPSLPPPDSSTRWHFTSFHLFLPGFQSTWAAETAVHFPYWFPVL